MVKPPVDLATAAGRPAAQHLDPRGRCGDRRPSAGDSWFRCTAIRARPMPVTQFDMKFVEEAGLVKFDFLGLKTLSVLRKACRSAWPRARASASIWTRCDRPGMTEAKNAYQAAGRRASTVGVFQLESEGMRRTLKAVKPTNFGDIIALVSLYRPGPMDNIPLFIAPQARASQSRSNIRIQKLEGILKETYGIIVYQEQVMQAAQVMAGYSSRARPTCCAAPWARRCKPKWTKQRRRCSSMAATERFGSSKRRCSQRTVRLDRQVRRLRLQQVTRSGLRAAGLSDRVAERRITPQEFYAASMCFDMHQSDKLAMCLRR